MNAMMAIQSPTPIVDDVFHQNNVNNGLGEEEKQKLIKAAKEFEALFMNEMMKAMRKTVDHSGLFGEKSQGEEVFTSMLDDEYSKLSTGNNQNGIGLAEMMVKQMENRNNFPATRINEYLRNVEPQE